MRNTVWLALAFVAACSTPATTQTEATAPLVINPAVTQATIGSTICTPGWSSSVRPPTSYTEPIKAADIAALPAAASHNPADYELDHWLPLEVGGAPANPANLVLQPIGDARTKDQMENAVHANVCAGLMTLAEGRSIFSHMKRP